MDKLKTVKNYAYGDEQATLLVYGGIGDEVNCKWLAEDINWLMNNGVNHLDIRINSAGGSVLDGFNLVSALNLFKQNGGTVNTYVDAFALSMGGVIAMVGHKIFMNDFAQIMIHDPYFTGKNTKLSEKEQNTIDALKGSISKMFENRGIGSKEEVAEIMSNETWYNSEKALEIGLIDEIISNEKKPDYSNAYQDERPNVLDMVALANSFLNEENQEEKQKETTKSKIDNPMNFTEISNKLGVEVANEEDVLNHIEGLNASITELETAKDTLEESVNTLTSEKEEALNKIEALENEAKTEKATALVEKAIENKQVNAEDKETLIEDAVNNYELVERMINSVAIAHANLKEEVENTTPKAYNVQEELQKIGNKK